MTIYFCKNHPGRCAILWSAWRASAVSTSPIGQLACVHEDRHQDLVRTTGIGAFWWWSVGLGMAQSVGVDVVIGVRCSL